MAAPRAPRLRPVDVIPFETEDGPCLALRDPERYAREIAAVTRGALPLLALLDGRHDLLDIQAALTRLTGEIVPSADIERLVERLDELLLLDSERFREAKASVDGAFLSAAARPAALAGQSYPDDPAALRSMLDGFFTHPDGPGGRPGAPSDRPLRAVLAPHIDFARGGPSYAHAYRAVAEGARGIDTFVILATAHQLGDGLFALTRKSFDTPLGRVATDQPLVDALAAALRAAGVDPFAHEIVHRGEHSAEFQVVWLQHLFGQERPFAIVPVLVGSFHPLLARRRPALEEPALAALCGALRRAIAERDGRVMVVGGIDLAHVGPQFGDPAPLTDDQRAALRRADLAMMEHVGRGDLASFWGSIAADGDARRICGFPPMTTLLASMDLAGGKLLRYAQSPDPNGVVSFVSMAFAG